MIVRTITADVCSATGTLTVKWRYWLLGFIPIYFKTTSITTAARKAGVTL